MGAGGLTRAYSNSTIEAINNSKIISALKIKNRAEDNTNDKTQMKEKEQQNSDYELFKKWWHEGMEVYSKKREQKNHKKMITEELCQKAEKLLTEENRQNLMYNTTEEITEKFSGEK